MTGKMGPYMKKYGSHGKAIKQMAKEYKLYKAKFGTITKTKVKKIKVVKKSKKKMSSATKKKMSVAMKKTHVKKILKWL